MWLLARTVTINNETYVSHILSNRVFTEKEEAYEKLKSIKLAHEDYKLFKVNLEEDK